MKVVKRDDYSLRIVRELDYSSNNLEKIFEEISKEYKEKGYNITNIGTGQLIVFKEGECYSFTRKNW